jgi:branched-chain amino acid transport system permease protein
MPVPPATLRGEPLPMNAVYLMTAALCFATLYVTRNIMRSRLGRAFVAIRDSEIAGQSMGVSISRYKTIAFGIGALFGGLSGGLYALAAEYVNPDAFVFTVSITYVTMCVVGGLGTLAGPVVGASILTLLPELLRPFAEYKEFLSGLVLLAFLVLMPKGLVPLISRAWRWVVHRIRKAAAPAATVP